MVDEQERQKPTTPASPQANETQQQTQQRLHTVVESLEDGYYEVNLHGEFIFVNQAMCAILGYSREEFLKTRYTTYTDTANGKRVRSAFAAVYKTGTPLKSYEGWLKHKDGRLRFIELSITPIKNSGGKITGFCGIVRDVTERKLEETNREKQLAEFKNLNAQLRELEDIKTFMLRLASHELRSPVTLIAGYADLLYDSLQHHFGSEERLYYDYIQRGIDRLMQMTMNILVLERMHAVAGKTEPPRKVVFLDDLTRKAMMDYRGESRLKGLTLNVELPELGVRVYGDENELSRAIGNLISNAIKYTSKGGLITVRVAAQGEKGVFDVSDNGCGIPDEHLSELFQAFSRINTDETKRIAGTGLGLYLVKKIIEWHGGQVTVKSVYQKGSTFGFTLPLVPTVPEAAATS